MRRFSAFSTAAFFLVAAAACGNGEPGADQEGAPPATQEQPAAQQGGDQAGGADQAQGEISMPDWFSYDEGENTVTLEIVAGETPDNNAWNFNGYFGGEGEIFVPAGAEVTIEFSNEDENMAHSIGVDDRRENFPANFSSVEPVFEGGVSSNPTSLTESTLAGESETITFTAGEPGEYSLVCYVPGHAAVGMYIHFTVTEEGGEVGFRG